MEKDQKLNFEYHIFGIIISQTKCLSRPFVHESMSKRVAQKILARILFGSDQQMMEFRAFKSRRYNQGTM